jgi:hypothetical protein
MSRQDSEKSSSESSPASTTTSPVSESDNELIPAQEMDFVCLGGRIQRSKDKADPDESYDYEWDEDGDLVFSKKVERGSRIDCWLGHTKKGAILRICYESYLTDETEAGEVLGVLGYWEWHKEMCKPPGGYNLVRNFWGEADGVPAIRQAIKDGSYDDSDDAGDDDEGELDNDWIKKALSALGDDE